LILDIKGLEIYSNEISFQKSNNFGLFVDAMYYSACLCVDMLKNESTSTLPSFMECGIIWSLIIRRRPRLYAYCMAKTTWFDSIRWWGSW